MAAEEEGPSTLSIVIELLAGILLGLWLACDFASKAGGGFLLWTISLIGGTLIGLLMGISLAMLIGLLSILPGFAYRMLWLIVLRVISRANVLPEFLNSLAARLIRKRPDLAPKTMDAGMPAVGEQSEDYAWSEDDAEVAGDDDAEDEYWRDYFPVLPAEELGTVNPNRMPRRMTRLSLVAAGLTAGAAALWIGAQGETMGAVVLAAVLGLVLGQFLPAVLNYLLGLAAALIQLAGEAILLVLMQLGRPLPVGARRIMAATAGGWDRLSLRLLVNWPHRLDVWLWGDKPFGAG